MKRISILVQDDYINLISKAIPKNMLLLVLTIGMSMCVSAQTFDYKSYNGIYSQGDIPDDMRKTVQELYEEDRGRMEQYTSKRKSRRSKGILECSYAINKMVQGGRILYGDPITQWVNRIADTILKNDPQLRGELRFYTYKSPAVNAFATGQGMIFVSTGLVSRLQSEAELAFILSHEIVHYVNNHTWENISVKAEEKARSRNTLDNMINKHNRSHRMEVEADSIGLVNYYLKTDYYNKVADDVLDVLAYSDYTMDNLPFDTTYFNTPYYTMPAEIWLDRVKPIEIDEEKSDSNSTHPNIGKRRALTYRITARMGEKGNLFICSSFEEFKHLQYLAQMETIRQLLISGAYVRAFYDSWCLLKEYPDNAFLGKSMAFSLYAMAKYKSQSDNNDMIGNYRDMEGEVQRLYYCFAKMKAADINVLAVRELYEYNKKHGASIHTDNMFRDAVQTLGNKHKLMLDNFLATPPEATEAAKTDTLKKVTSKYERLKKGSKSTREVADKRKYVFTDLLMAGDDFANAFNQSMTDTLKRQIEDGSTLILSPSYRCYNRKKELDIKTSERKEQKLSQTIAEVLNQKGDTAIEYNGHLLKQQTSDTFYNQYMALNEWIREVDGNISMHLITQEDVDKVFDEYNVSNVAIAGVRSLAWQGPKKYLTLPLPFMVYRNVANRCLTQTAAAIVDKNGNVCIGNTEELTRNDEKALVKQQIYNHITNATNPGYMGKHVMIGLSGEGFVSNPFERFLYGFKYGIRAEGVISKKISIDLGSKLYNVEKIYTISEIEFGVKRYVRSATAPLGPYYKIGLKGLMLTAEGCSLSRESELKALVSADDNKSEFLKKVGIVPAFTLGRTYIVGNRLLMDFFYTMGLQVNEIQTFPTSNLYIGLGMSLNILAF